MSNKTMEIKGVLVNQLTSKPLAISAIDFPTLRNIIKFTSREPQNYDPFVPTKKLEQVEKDVKNSYYQRLTNDKRVNNIYKFLLKEISNIHSTKTSALGSFPTSVIISLELNQDYETKEEYLKFIETAKQEDYIGAFYKELEDNNIELTVPYGKYALIVDGQHRLMGMIKLFKDASNNEIKIGRNKLKDEYPNLSNEIVLDYIKKFEFNCTLLLGFDKWEQGKVFADVNFNQKPVNKSLYYDIFGSYPDPNKNDIFLSHMLAMHLNNNKDSVIQGFIKMLGSGKGYFSQAFFVEAILYHFRPKGIWASLPMDYLNDGDDYKILPKFFKSYLKAIKETFNPYWPKDGQDTSRKYPNILCKTTGMGALIKLIDPIYRKLKKDTDFKSIKPEELTELLKSELLKAKEKGSDFFSKEGDFSGSGSLGLQNKLYTALGQELGYFKK